MRNESSHFGNIHTSPWQKLHQANDLVSKVFMDRRLRDDGSEQGSANIWLCGIPPTDAIPNFNFTGLNTTLLYVAPPEKVDEVRIVKKNHDVMTLF